MEMSVDSVTSPVLVLPDLDLETVQEPTLSMEDLVPTPQMEWEYTTSMSGTVLLEQATLERNLNPDTTPRLVWKHLKNCTTIGPFVPFGDPKQVCSH
jgi:hypothetical protein